MGITFEEINMRPLMIALAAFTLAMPALAQQKSPGAGPVFVVETMKGTIEIETYPNEAPKTVDHILALIKRNFYNGQRILRIVPNQLVQFGDPQTRDMTKQAWWGRGFDAGSGKSIGCGGVQQEAVAQGRVRVDGASGRRARSRQPDVHFALRAAEMERAVHGLRPGDFRNGRRPQARGDGSNRQSNFETGIAVVGPFVVGAAFRRPFTISPISG